MSLTTDPTDYVCRCNNGHRPPDSAKCNKANCHNCCKGKGGVNTGMMADDGGRNPQRIESVIGPQNSFIGSYSNFVDSDTMEYSGMPDSDQWSNHPGFLGGTWWKDFWSPKKAEKERYDKAVADKKSKYKLTADIDCDTIDDTISKIDNAIVRNANSGAKDRVVSRESRALENRRLDFKQRWEADDCSQQRIDEQRIEFEQNIQGMFNTANLRSAERKTDDKTLQNVALGVGALVIGGVVWMALRR